MKIKRREVAKIRSLGLALLYRDSLCYIIRLGAGDFRMGCGCSETLSDQPQRRSARIRRRRLLARISVFPHQHHHCALYQRVRSLIAPRLSLLLLYFVSLWSHSTCVR